MLLIEVFRLECDRQTGAALTGIDLSAPVAQLLRLAARHMLTSFLSELNRAVFRVCLAKANRFPELGAAFYETGPLWLRREIIGYLAQAQARRDLTLHDLDLAADQFMDPCKADL